MKKTITRKIYRAFSKGMSVQLSIGNNTRLVSFIHANPTGGENAYLVSDEPEIQEAMENSPSYGVDYFLERQTNYETEVRDIPKPVVETVNVNEAGSAVDAAPASDESDPEDETPATPEDGITNAAQAKAYLLDKFEDDKPAIVALKRADEVREYAKAKGIVFPNWE